MAEGNATPLPQWQSHKKVRAIRSWKFVMSAWVIAKVGPIAAKDGYWPVVL